MVVDTTSGTYLCDPTPDHLLTFWQTFTSDPSTAGRYMDTMPTTLHGFLAPAAAGTMRAWALLLDGQLAGLSWLHDINCWGGQNTAWKGMYIFPEFRRISTVDWSKISSDAAAAIGLPRNFSGIRVKNEIAMGFAHKTGFTLAGVVEKFGWFLGELDDLAIWSRYPEDAPEALRQAHLRAAYYRAHPPAKVLTAAHEALQ